MVPLSPCILLGRASSAALCVSTAMAPHRCSVTVVSQSTSPFGPGTDTTSKASGRKSATAAGPKITQSACVVYDPQPSNSPPPRARELMMGLLSMIFILIFLFNSTYLIFPTSGMRSRRRSYAGRHAEKVPSTSSKCLLSASANTSSASALVIVKGFSQSTCFPPRSALRQWSACAVFALATYRTSTQGSATISSRESARAKPYSAHLSAISAESLPDAEHNTLFSAPGKRDNC
mmetsp:Transcript_15680/g.27160  ORF Transcript_15680/g.27160 Transcript_15680/m.27160 type:complete len:234 (-) Transcript_15680:132-833(-)